MVCKNFLKSKSFLRYVVFSLCDTVESNYLFLAASIAYYTLMSIIPLFIFLFFLGTAIFHLNLQNLIPKEIFNSPLKPVFLQIKQVLNNSGLISGTAAIIMFWYSRGIFLSFERSFCEILKTKNPAGYFYKNMVIILIVFLLWILMFAFYLTKYLIILLFPQFPLISFISSLIVPILLFTILVCLYYFLLPIKVSFELILKISTFIFVILIVFWKFFEWFIVNVSKVNVLYGSFTAVIVFLIWIYYSATVILIGVGMVKAKLITEEEMEE